MKSTAIIAVLGLAAAAFAAPAAAQTTRGGYLGFNVGQSKFNFSGCSSPCDDKGRDYKLFGGFQFNRYAALEVGYSDMGKTTFGASRLKATAWELSGVGTWGVPMGAGGMGLSLLGRLGLYNGEVTAETPSTGAADPSPGGKRPRMPGWRGSAPMARPSTSPATAPATASRMAWTSPTRPRRAP